MSGDHFHPLNKLVSPRLFKSLVCLWFHSLDTNVPNTKIQQSEQFWIKESWTHWYDKWQLQTAKATMQSNNAKRLLRYIVKWLQFHPFDESCLLACSVPLVSFGGNGRFMVVLRYSMSLRQAFLPLTSSLKESCGISQCLSALLTVCYTSFTLILTVWCLFLMWERDKINVCVHSKKGSFWMYRPQLLADW